MQLHHDLRHDSNKNHNSCEFESDSHNTKAKMSASLIRIILYDSYRVSHDTCYHDIQICKEG